VRRIAWLLWALPFGLAGACAEDEAVVVKSEVPKVGPRVAFARDFADFRRWRRVALPDDSLTEGHESSPRRFVYLDRALPAEAEPVPEGTMIVKTIEVGPMDEWELHAMVKRGDGYNADGCAGWEFFNLELSAEGEVSIAWRGQGDDPSAYMDTQGNNRSCNSCHIYGVELDYVFSRRLSPELRDAPEG